MELRLAYFTVAKGLPRLLELYLNLKSQAGVLVHMVCTAGMFPMPVSPVYAAAKAGVVHLVRSAGGRACPVHMILPLCCCSSLTTKQTIVICLSFLCSTCVRPQGRAWPASEACGWLRCAQSS